MLPIGDERLGAIDDVVITITHRGGANALQVRTGTRLRHGNSTHHFTRNHLWQILLLHFCAAVMLDIRCHDVCVQTKTNARQPKAGDLFHHNGGIQIVGTHTAELFRQAWTQHALLTGLIPECAVNLAIFFPLGMEWHGFFLKELDDHVSEGFVVGIENTARNHVGLSSWLPLFCLYNLLEEPP